MPVNLAQGDARRKASAAGFQTSFQTKKPACGRLLVTNKASGHMTKILSATSTTMRPAARVR